MAAQRSTLKLSECTRMLVVQTDANTEFALNEWQQDQNVRRVLTSSTAEALELIRDIVFIEASFDALLCDASLPDGGVYKVIEEFRNEFPGAPVAVLSSGDDICLQVWTRARRIRVFKKPLQLSDVQTWVENLPHKPEPLPLS